MNVKDKSAQKRKNGALELKGAMIFYIWKTRTLRFGNKDDHRR